ncbi:hypothetical protein Tco_1515016 [Tanacetum coccineum]
MNLHLGGSEKQLCSTYGVETYIRSPSTGTSTTLPPLTPEELKVDKIVLSWILFTLSDSIQARLVVARTQSAKEAWGLISEIFKDNKRSRTNALKAELRSIKLGDQSMESYFQKADSVVNILTSLMLLALALHVDFLSLGLCSLWDNCKFSHDTNAKSSDSSDSKVSGTKTDELLEKLLAKLSLDTSLHAPGLNSKIHKPTVATTQHLPSAYQVSSPTYYTPPALIIPYSRTNHLQANCLHRSSTTHHYTRPTVPLSLHPPSKYQQHHQSNSTIVWPNLRVPRVRPTVLRTCLTARGL